MILDRSTFSLTLSPTILADRGSYQCTAEYLPSKNTKEKNFSLKSDPVEIDVIGDILADIAINDSCNQYDFALGPPSPPGRPLVASYTSRTATLTWERSVSHPDAPVLLYRTFAA